MVPHYFFCSDASSVLTENSIHIDSDDLQVPDVLLQSFLVGEKLCTCLLENVKLISVLVAADCFGVMTEEE